jgi:F0F1-type ATP synthase delta subunit
MLKVTLITAGALDKRTAEKFKKAVTNKRGKDVEFEFRVDPKVIGGVKAVIGSKSIDLTIAGKLTQIRKQLLAKI